MKRMTKLLALALGVLFVFASTSMVQAAPIVWDFESVAIGTYNSLVYTNGWFSMTLYRGDASDFAISDLSAWADASWGDRTLDPWGSFDGAYYVLEFSHAVTDISIDYSDFNEDYDTPGVEGYDEWGSYLGSDFQNWADTDEFPDYGTLSLGGIGNMSYVYFGTDAFDEYPNSLYFDNISVNAVPEPGTLALLGIGLAGLAARRRNRKS